MKTVHEVSALTGVSIRTLHHYDNIGLLPATSVTAAGYRLYDDAALERLQLILLFRELEFSLKEIKTIMDAPGFDRDRALAQQIRLLELRKEHLEDLIDLARGIKKIGVKQMNFDAFDTRKIDAYEEEAKAAWGTTEAYKEFEKKSQGRTKETQQKLGLQMMEIFRELGELRDGAADSPEAIALVKKLQAYITTHYYTCTDEILSSLGNMYAGGGAFTENIDKAGGEGTAVFTQAVIEAYLSGKNER